MGLLYFLNVPFYAGSSLGGGVGWRMEHGRLTVHRRAGANPESLYIAPNSEGLRFTPRWRWFGIGDWGFTLPLWIPLGLSAGGAALAFRHQARRRRHLCGCGYPRIGLDPSIPCPECGRTPTSRS